MRDIVEVLKSGRIFREYQELVETKEQDKFVLLNYSRECQFRSQWDEVTLACRGLIVDTADWSVAALPFPKFFNLGEHSSTLPENLPREPFRIFEKIDGSLGILYRDRSGQACLATRGSFNSEQAIQGTAMLRQLAAVAEIPQQLTFLFEIVYSANKTVIKYGFDGLVLLGIYNRFSFEERPWEEVTEWAAKLGVQLPKVYHFNTIQEAKENVKTLPANLEGYVIRFENGLRVKLKGNAYLDLHRLVWSLTPGRVLEALTDGWYFKLRKDLPEELWVEVETLAKPYMEHAEGFKQTALNFFARAPKEDGPEARKKFAIWVQQNVPLEIRPAMFQLLNGQMPNWYKFLKKQ